MERIIQLLPDHLANQIAAGEVVQRPASVVKELLENSLDAGASEISLIIEDAGKKLVQVIDNGSGMSIHDARMCFERHATSKIRETNDLFNIRTMGFRGEAMASIAAVAQIQLKSRRPEDELGTEVRIEGSEFISQIPCACPSGTVISVKNLFFNVPARRNFLKSNPVETRHIMNEFIRVALSHPKVAMKFIHNNSEVFDLPAATAKGRIPQLINPGLENNLLDIEQETTYVKMFGYIGSPATARKARGDQFFFVNKRFIKSPYLHHAISSAYQNLIPSDQHPFYCIYLEIEPKHVDINIHPTKSEVKFDDERTIYNLLQSVIRKALAGFHEPEKMEFGDQSLIRIFQEAAKSNETQNPGQIVGGYSGRPGYQKEKNISSPDWEKFYFSEVPDVKREEPVQLKHTATESREREFFSQLNDTYIITSDEGGLMIIHQNLAHQRILFEKYLKAGKNTPVSSQQLLFPKTLSFALADARLLNQYLLQLQQLGFDLKEFGNDAFILHGVPQGIDANKVESILEELLSAIKEADEGDAAKIFREKMAVSIARYSAIQAGKKLNDQELRTLVRELHQCEHPGISPSGKPTCKRIGPEMLANFFHQKK